MAAPAQPTKTDTFAAISACFSRDLAALISEDAPHDPTPNEFIDLVVRARDFTADARGGQLQTAQQALDRAVTRLTDALTSSGNDQRSLLARARMYLRTAIEATR
ncbi:hypothetical protein [Streptomyces sp. NPDC091217]|uniref:hypothetical protein n=1 Tax=Streptomyces sp. NPDC091217 TaxID=3365975 RepID=UPI0038006A9E